jgi:primosomal protein N'
MTCDHQWIVRMATLPSGQTFHSAYVCGKCGLVVGVCPAGQHPFGFPDYRGRQPECAWCKTDTPGDLNPQLV